MLNLKTFLFLFCLLFEHNKISAKGILFDNRNENPSGDRDVNYKKHRHNMENFELHDNHIKKAKLIISEFKDEPELLHKISAVLFRTGVSFPEKSKLMNTVLSILLL